MNKRQQIIYVVVNDHGEVAGAYEFIADAITFVNNSTSKVPYRILKVPLQ